MPPSVSTFSGDTMGTQYHVSVVSAGRKPDALQREIDARLAAVDTAMSTWRTDSELSRFNAHRGTDWVPVSRPLYTVLAAARAVSEETDGAFDVTIGPVVDLWGFGPQRRAPAPPPADALAAARVRVGYRLLQLADDPPRVRKGRADVHVDLSAIAKGYAVDRVAAALDAAGHAHYLVEVGGEIRSRGQRAEGTPWRVGVAMPAADTAIVERVLALRDTSLATSGDYRQFFEYAGQRYSHEIDPVTARPIAHALAAVTVLADTCMRADALATGLLVLGPERGPARARELGLTALFLVRRGNGFDARVTGRLPLALPAQ